MKSWFYDPEVLENIAWNVSSTIRSEINIPALLTPVWIFLTGISKPQ